jgi:hypothetical protein
MRYAVYASTYAYLADFDKIDVWIKTHDGEGADKLRRKQLEEIETLPPDLTKIKFEKDECESMQEAWSLVKDEDCLYALVAFRAVLMAAFLSTCADISSVRGTPLGRRVVQFI